MAYLRGLFSAVTGGLYWWLSLLFAYIFGVAAFSDYERIRDTINSRQSVVEMPTDVPLWLIVIPFLVWVIARLAHNEAMRYTHAARVHFAEPYIVFAPLSAWVEKNGKLVREKVADKYIARIDVKNIPFSATTGMDVRDAWSEIELFDLSSKPIKKWGYPRWTENEKPGYQGNPVDRYLHEWNFRTLSANGSSNSIDIASKEYDDEFAYPLRGRDQRNPVWKDEDMKIARGEYLVRLRIHGIGLQKPAERCFLLKNPGPEGRIELCSTPRSIERYWH